MLMMAKAGEVDMIVNTFSGKQLADYKNMGWRTNSYLRRQRGLGAG